MRIPSETESPHYLLLRQAARLELDDESCNAINSICRENINWDRLVTESESHGLSPLLYQHLRTSEAPAPANTLSKLRVLYLRHRASNLIRTAAACEVDELLEQHGIAVVYLKGMALCHLIYAEPGHRPMSDIDLLVSSRQKEEVYNQLVLAGYQHQTSPGIREDHHHLPALSKSLEGLSVSIEVHDNAIGPDNLGSIQMDNLTDKPVRFGLGDRSANSLGHVDMLRHLCRHTLEPLRVTKLGGVLDTVAYADRFAEHIDWFRLTRSYPEVIAALQMFSYLIHWPENLGRYVAEPGMPCPPGVGIGMMPLSRIRHAGSRSRLLFDPSDWWLRAYYSVPMNRSVTYTKAITHPIQLGRWLWRRARFRNL